MNENDKTKNYLQNGNKLTKQGAHEQWRSAGRKLYKPDDL